jgi:hypothetical protein
VKRFRDWTEAVRIAMERTTDLDQIVELLEEEAKRDVETGSQAEVDLGRLEILSGVRINAMGIMRYWQKRREREAEAPER